MVGKVIHSQCSHTGKDRSACKVITVMSVLYRKRKAKVESFHGSNPNHLGQDLVWLSLPQALISGLAIHVFVDAKKVTVMWSLISVFFFKMFINQAYCS
jgi:hypothetical protein